ncbi:hypothetical protein OG552_14725 [Streptomyces sp. NBC_01476]|uniref:hypothetical protein n=1 Tax=Streptomyces sp. NBC_01476 TaxID=2903881 RepID=UPI002E376868|nr:hypothetical protein [Streptomyces sp. NBC_01476]
MHLTLEAVAAAAAGGLFAAAVGALAAFVLCGLAILVGVGGALGAGNPWFLTHVALGEWFGPHVAFAGAVAALAYAARRGKISSGRDIVTGLVSLADPVTLLVGAVFGVFGLVVQSALNASHWMVTYTNTTAITVVASAVVARLLFGRTGLFGSSQAAGLRNRLRTTPTAAWLPWQEKPLMAGLLGLAVGFLASWSAVELVRADPSLGVAAGVLAFGVSAMSLVFLATPVSVPATHHVTSVAAATGLAFSSVWVGAVAGLATALIGEGVSRLFLIHADTHIDPPAVAIAVMTPVCLTLATVLT